MSWNFGDMLDAVAPVVAPDAPALIHGERVISWRDFDRRSNNLARALAARGARPGDKIAFYMRNRPEYSELLAACFKGRFVHVNVNYRYQPEELFYIFDNCDAQTIAYGAEFRAHIEALRERLPKVRNFVEIADGATATPDRAIGYETLVAEGDGAPLGIQRSPEDLFFIYTGGTTGMPKGVMWEQGTMREAQLAGLRMLGPVPANLAEHVELVRTTPGVRQIPACPMMHGTGLLTAIGTLLGGGTVVTLTKPSFDAVELWETVSRHQVNALAIVGDAFAKPMLRELEVHPGRYELASVTQIISSGVMWSREVKHGLLAHMPQAVLLDSFGSSEGIGFGTAITTKDSETDTAIFAISDRCRVFDAAGKEVVPGSGEIGVIALGGPIPVGYYKDPKKTAETFRTVNGARYSMPGDWCTVAADGSITLLGRGSVCINTAGEKVFPEEVEEVIKRHPDVEDCLVVGVADEKWGQAVTAVVQPANGGHIDEKALREHARRSLAGYKTPKHFLRADIPLRAPNGKADYKGTARFAQEKLGLAG